MLIAPNAITAMAERDLLEGRKLSRKEIRESSSGMTSSESRFLVDNYYIAQRERIRLDNQIRSMVKDGEPNLVLTYLSTQASKREELIKKALNDYTVDHPVGSWMRTIHGVGPVIAAGFLAHIDITKAPTAGAIWRFAGITGAEKWEKGQKRPWNASLKRLTFLLGECFVKTSGNEKSYYGKLYKQRKLMETEKNLNGEYAEFAAAELASKNYSKDTPTYAALSSGKLSAAHIHARARRYAVKMFLSHLHTVMYRTILGTEPPAPYAIAILGHAHLLEVPNPEHIREFIEPIDMTEEEAGLNAEKDEE